MSFRSLLVLLALVLAVPAAAQQTHTAGDRLRVYAPSVPIDREAVGRRDSVTLSLQPSLAARGKRTLLGAVAGFAVSTVVVVASDPGSWDCGGEFCGLGQSILIVSGATIAGAIIGYITD
jgi:hypothetical protein